jgi:hypothetical protein
MCQHVGDKVVVGDGTNVAVFWSERYYECKPILSLLPLAADSSERRRIPGDNALLGQPGHERVRCEQ